MIANVVSTIRREEREPRRRHDSLFLESMEKSDFRTARNLLEADGQDPDVCYENIRKIALHHAAEQDDVEAVRLLVTYGANEELEEDDGFTALEIAELNGSKEVIKFLNECREGLHLECL